MKFALVLIASFALAANADVDFDQLKPLDIYPAIPMFPEDQVKARIVGGQEAEPHQFKHQAGIAIHLGDKQGWCGGSIISPDYILTAAHCTDKADAVTVHLGCHNIKEADDACIKIRVEKENIVVHPKWSMLTLQNDISLIKLSVPIQFNDNIESINLPTRTQAKLNYDGKTVVASGWGKDSDKATGVSPVLRFVEVAVLPKWRCNIRFFGKIKDSHICISGSGGKSTCNGDSGGPLIITEEDGSKTLLGATSFGIALGCEIGWPGVFTRVSSFLDWIQENSNIKIRA